jgi:hypothetical protein
MHCPSLLHAFRCGLAVPELADGEEISSMPEGAHKKGYSALKQPWRPDTTSEVTQKYSKKVNKRLGNTGK